MTKGTDKGRVALFTPAFLEDLRWWVKTDRKMALRILDLLDAVLRDPFEGIGKPEPLKHLGPGTWSRRITHDVVQPDLVFVSSQRREAWNAGTEVVTICDHLLSRAYVSSSEWRQIQPRRK